MKLKTITWNVGGCKLLRDGADPNLVESYDVDGLEAVAAFLKAQNADAITLQEIPLCPPGQL